MVNAILGTKQDMTQLFDEEKKEVLPCSIIKTSDCIIAGVRTLEKDGYSAVILGLGRKNKPTRPEKMKYKELGYVPGFLKEVRVKSTDGIEIGKTVLPDTIGPGEKIKITGISKGKGFQGVVKRWGFAGGPKTHGQSDRWRAPGSIGAGTTPGRVWKGKKMPGRMGNESVSLNSEVIKVDSKNGILAVKGSIPGGRHSLLLITKK